MTLHPCSLHEVKGERSAFDSSSPVMCSHAGMFSLTVRGNMLSNVEKQLVASPGSTHIYFRHTLNKALCASVEYAQLHTLDLCPPAPS